MKIVLMDDIYNRLCNGIYFDQDLKIYSKEMITTMINKYEGKEDYEKCHFLKKLINNRFSHDNLYKQENMKTSIKELLELSEKAPKKMIKELELFFCNCNLDSPKRKELIEIINKNIFNPNVGK